MSSDSASGSAASSAASDVSESPLDDVLSKMEFATKECTDDGQGGGAPDISIDEPDISIDEPNISIDEITILVILFHGTIEIKRDTCSGNHCGPIINVRNLSSIENLAYLALAPTGLPNIGTNYELHAYRTYIEYEIKEKIVESLQKIEKKADELVTENASQHVSQPVSQPVKKRKDETQDETQTTGIFSIICKYCFSLPKQLLSSIQALGNLLTNYKFTDNFTVCKSVGSVSLSGGNGLNHLKGGTKRGRIPPLSMSYDMFVLMLNDLRLKIKKFDSDRITELCNTQLKQLETTTPSPPPDYCETLKQTLQNIEKRCRSLYILKGLNTTKLPDFTNKHLSYDSSLTKDGKSTVDANKNMGVIKLQFKINSSSGNVECIPRGYNAHDVMKAIAYSKPQDEVHGGVYWSTMEACINHCTQGDPNSGTTFVIDLTCSSVLGAECSLFKESSLKSIKTPGGGGGKRIKKKSGSRKKTRRVKNKSRTTRYIRNRRNRLKNNKRTKKSRKTKTSRKH